MRERDLRILVHPVPPVLNETRHIVMPFNDLMRAQGVQPLLERKEALATSAVADMMGMQQTRALLCAVGAGKAAHLSSALAGHRQKLPDQR